MIVNEYFKPWPYFEVYDFLNSQDFDIVREFSNSIPISESRRTSVVLHEGIEHSILSSAMHELCQKIQYRITDGMEITVQFDVIAPGFDYKIHNDNPKKYVTFVLAISEQGTGTNLYYANNKDSYYSTTKWIPNGGNGFVRQNYTWHDFNSIGLNDYRRTAIVMLAQKGWDRV